MKYGLTFVSIFIVMTITACSTGVSGFVIQDELVYKRFSPFPFTGKMRDGSGWTMYKNGKTEGKSVSFYSNGNLEYEINYINGKAEGAEKWYYENGKTKETRTYKNGIYEGIRKNYYESGKIKSELTYKNNKREGPLKSYYESGEVRGEYNYKNGSQEGIGRSYYKSGRVWLESNYVNEYVVYDKAYYENGQKKRAVLYNSQGKSISSEFLYENGNLKK
ncbi:toxin-antitoxin system YwqK family antitoxin [Aeromonas salmonicida]|uniref:toxin-antitoxin system YwqK family antitoxin n=1 Tax=Aeromonas salmonicida TaxID=645 RepID=UPI0022409C11|nr:toxin-antitoxin system YwqK family antitoxin [Aeromonas salmonicida]